MAETRSAQEELKGHISELSADLELISHSPMLQQQQEGGPLDLEAAIEKLNSAKKRVVVVANLLQGSQVINE